MTVVAAVLVSIVVLAPCALGVRAHVRREGIERDVLLRATSIAFFVTMGTVGVYAPLQSIAGAPAVSMWFPWMVGGVSWSVAAGVLHRRVA